MSGTLQQGIPYGDRPIAYNQGSGAYATTEFLQYLERLSSAIRSVPNSAAALQTQVNTNSTSITSINSQISALHTTDTGLQDQINGLKQKPPIQWITTPSTAIALTSGTPAVVMQQTMPPGYFGMFASVYFTGSGTLTWGRASIGINSATIETAGGQCGNIYVGSASPATLGWDLAVDGMAYGWVSSWTQVFYLNAAASFSGSISAYGSLLVLQL